MTDDQLDEKITSVLSGMPEELRRSVEAKVSLYKSKRPSFTNADILREARELVNLEMLAFMDRREDLAIYNRKFATHRLLEAIREISKKETVEEKELYTLGLINFDLNGLKALNDLGGHAVGNVGLSTFAAILKGGVTTTWLRSLGFDVIPFTQGGDEFGIVLTGNIDLRPITAEIFDRYFGEVETTDVSRLIDFSTPDIQEKLRMLGIADDVAADFKFQISTSVGVVTFGEALAFVPVAETGKSYDEVSMMLVNKMYEISDKRSMVQKSAYKEQLAKSNPILSGLYARMSKKVIHLEKEIRKRDDRLRELEARYDESKNCIAELEKELKNK